VVLLEKKFEETFENPLTNRPSCDTIRVSRGESRLAESNRQWLALAVKMKIKAPLKKNVKNPLTNRPSCDTIRMSRGSYPEGSPQKGKRYRVA
jgi:hypothetical protein